MYSLIDRWASPLAPHAWWLLTLYLVVPVLFKAALQPYVPIDLTVGLAIPTAVVGLACIARLANRGGTALALWTVLTILIVAGALYAPDDRIALDSAARWVLLAALPLLAAFGVGNDANQLRKLLVALAAVGIFVAIAGLLVMPTITAGELELFNTNRLGVARAVLLVPLILVPLVWRLSFGWVLAAVVICAVTVFVAVATGSRGAVLGFVVVAGAIALLAIVRSHRKSRLSGTFVGTVAVTATLFLAFGWMLPEHALARFGLLTELVQPSTEPSGETPSAAPLPTSAGGPTPTPPSDVPAASPVAGESVAVRADLYRLAILQFADHPLVGAGTGGFEAAAKEADLALYPHPHNVVLHAAADLGILGIMVLGAMAILALLRLWKVTGGVGVALGGTLAFLAINALLSNGIYDNRMLWGIWLVAMALRNQGWTDEGSVPLRHRCRGA